MNVIASIPAKIAANSRALTNLGLRSYLRYKAATLRLRRLRSGTVPLSSRYARNPLSCRARTSDLNVFYQIFIEREYRCLDDVRSADFIIDCGANVGYSTAYMLSRFPNARVVAVEPDSSNFACLKQNLSSYGDRVTLVHSGVWSHPCGLVMSEDRFRDGMEWSRQVREARPGEAPAMTAVDIATILRDAGSDRISILKIDVEGAEREIFSHGFEQWLPRVDNLVIELHGEENRRIFFKAIESEGFKVSACEELTVCRR